MKLFSRPEPTAVEVAEAALGKARERRDRIAAQLAQTENELVKAKQQATEAAFAERPVQVSELSGTVAQHGAAVEALGSALTVADDELRQAEAALARERDLEQRAESVRVIGEIIEAIDVAAPTISAGVDDLIAALRRASSVSLDARQVLGVFEALHSDLSVLIDTATSALAHHQVLIENGSMPARLPAPEAHPVARSALPETVSVCLLFDLRWRDPATGLDRHVAKGWDAGLVPALAARAIAAGVAVRSDSEKAKKLRVQRGAPVANPDAIDLDNPAVAPPGPPPEHTINPHVTQWQLPSGSPPRAWVQKGQL